MSSGALGRLALKTRSLTSRRRTALANRVVRVRHRVADGARVLEDLVVVAALEGLVPEEVNLPRGKSALPH